jgi:hypothetical protein
MLAELGHPKRMVRRQNAAGQRLSSYLIHRQVQSGTQTRLETDSSSSSLNCFSDDACCQLGTSEYQYDESKKCTYHDTKGCQALASAT